EERLLPARREADDSRAWIPLCPAQSADTGEQRRAERAREMLAPLAPIHAGPAQGAALMGRRRRVDTHLRKPFGSPGREPDAGRRSGKHLCVKQGFESHHSEFARKMVIA